MVPLERLRAGSPRTGEAAGPRRGLVDAPGDPEGLTGAGPRFEPIGVTTRVCRCSGTAGPGRPRRGPYDRDRHGPLQR